MKTLVNKNNLLHKKEIDMAKYIDSEKLIAEIERRLEKYDPDYTSAGFELKELLSFIDSLQHEQPEPTEGIKGNLEGIPSNVDLEKEIETYFKEWYMDETDQGYILHTPDDHAGLMSVKQVARHFYELGLNARKEE